MFFTPRSSIAQMTTPLPRQEVIRRARIAILDDDIPEILEDLRRHGFSVDHLPNTEDVGFRRAEEAFYDVLLLDYGGIGTRFGRDDGLDVLRHLKRVNPALRIIAFTARTFDASKADFFRLCDGVLTKDAGIRETLEEVEQHVRDTLTPAHYWTALCSLLNLSPDSKEARKLESQIQKSKGDSQAYEKITRQISTIAKAGGTAIVGQLVKKLLEILIAHVG